MKVLLINKYLYPRGGAEISTLRLYELLKSRGHKVVLWGMDHPLNGEVQPKQDLVSYIDFNQPMNSSQQLKAAQRIIYSFEARAKLGRVLKRERPDLVHLNNFSHQLSPSILDALKKFDLPVIMTLRDYKLVCPAYLLFRRGAACELCKQGKYYHCFLNRCTKNSLAKSMVNVLEMYLHQKIRHCFSEIDLFTTTSEFARRKFVEMGFPYQIQVLPNFVDVTEFTPQYQGQGRTVVFFGRLSPEKGLLTLLKAVKSLDLQLKIIGEGPLLATLKETIQSGDFDNVKLIGFKFGQELNRAIGEAMVTVLPSEWYEPFGNTIIESYALGKPVIASDIGGIPEYVHAGVTGFTFKPQDQQGLQEVLRKVVDNPSLAREMGRNARRYVVEHFDATAFYPKLMAAYEAARTNHQGHSHP